jgi:uncharacterized protein (DUF433 family)
MAAEPELKTEAVDAVGHIVKTPGVVGGKARIAGTRIRVMDVVIWYEGGAPVDEIIEAFPTLKPADVHAAMAYYHDNREEIEAEFEADERFEEEFRKAHPEAVLDV